MPCSTSSHLSPEVKVLLSKMPTPAIVYAVTPSAVAQPDAILREYFGGDVPGRQAHQQYRGDRGPGGAPMKESEILSLYHVHDAQTVAKYVSEHPLPSNIIDVRVYNHIRNWNGSEDNEKPLPGQISVAVSLSPPKDLVADCDKWYEEEHVNLLSQVPGWRSSQRYKQVIGKGPDYLALHHYVPPPDTPLSSIPEFKAAVATEWTKKIIPACTQQDRGYERREWDYQLTIPIAPTHLSEKFRKFVVDFYKTSDKPGAHEEYVSNLTDDAWVAFNGTKTTGREAILKLRGEMWTRIIKRHHRADIVYQATEDELAIYGSSYFTGADGTVFPNSFWARMKFQDPAADKLKLILYEVNKREKLSE